MLRLGIMIVKIVKTNVQRNKQYELLLIRPGDVRDRNHTDEEVFRTTGHSCLLYVKLVTNCVALKLTTQTRNSAPTLRVLKYSRGTTQRNKWDKRKGGK